MKILLDFGLLSSQFGTGDVSHFYEAQELHLTVSVLVIYAGPSASVSIPWGQGTALEVARSLLDLGGPPEADSASDALAGSPWLISAETALLDSPSDTEADLPEVPRCAGL